MGYEANNLTSDSCDPSPERDADDESFKEIK
jgi:hypothetical protein